MRTSDPTEVRDLLRVGPGPVDLSAIDPRATPGLPRDRAVRSDPKAWSRGEVGRLGKDLAGYQDKLYATAKVTGDTRRVLLLLQAMDCGGKDGTVKNVVGAMNPLGLRIVAFGPPTEEERQHDFLWRVRRALPAPGQVGMFNRSHYEDVLIVRVHGLVPKRTWQARYDRINQFERDLAGSGVTIVKVMLHISAEEQRQRLLDRLAEPSKRWKFNPSDVEERQFWPAYQEAYVDALSRCGTDHAPWHVVPADRKWYRNWAVANLLLAAFADLDLSYPDVPFDVEEQRKRVESDIHPGGPDGRT